MTLRTDSIYGHSEPFGYDGMNRLTSGSEDSYAYCLNNPLKFIDPSGLQFIYRKREYLLLDLFVSAGLGVADAIWGEQLYDWVDDNF